MRQHRPFHGRITEVTRLGADGDFARYAPNEVPFCDNAQARIRYTQAGATLSEDSLDRWLGQRRIDTGELNATSWDYRSRSTRPQSAGSSESGASLRTVAWHDPGQYAWQNSAHGERMLTNQRQAIDVRRTQYRGEGTVRTGAIHHAICAATGRRG